MELVLASFYGILAGILVGLLPGLGTTAFLIICFPFLIKQSLLFCILFYCVLSSTSQYFGSITTLTLGIPGENTSLPLFSIRKKIIENSNLNQVYYLCALGSLLASLLSCVLLYLSIDFFYTNIFYLKSYFSLFFAILGFILCIFYSNNRPLYSFILLLFGWFLGKIGYNEITNTSFMTFNNPYLYSGIPTLPAIMGVYALPSLYFMFKRLNTKKADLKFENFDILKSSLTNSLTIFRASLIGFISGLIPYIGNGISSNLAFNIEKKLSPNNHIAQATASESANNSANIAVLIPLLILGVAIIPSEFVLLEIIASSNTFVSWKDLSNNFLWIVIFLLITNIISFYVSWNCIQLFNKFVVRMSIILPVLLSVFVISSIFFLGFELSQGSFYLLVLVCFFLLGLVLNGFDLLPFIYAFLLQNNVEQIFYRFYQIYIL